MPIPKNINLNEKVENLQQFSEAIYPRQAENVAVILQSISDGSLNNAEGLMRFIKEKKIDYNTFNAIIRKLKRLGIIYKTGWQTFHFSSVFQIRLCKMMDFYTKFTGKPNPYHKMKAQYMLLTKGIDIPVTYEEEEEPITKPKPTKAKEAEKLAEEEEEGGEEE